MKRLLLFWTASFVASFTTMVLLDRYSGPDPVATPAAIRATGFADDGLNLVVEPADGDTDGRAGQPPEVANSPGVSVETATGTEGESDREPESASAASVAGPAPYSLVATARASSVTARVAPSAEADVLGEFANPVPSGAPLVFQVERSGTTSSADWIEVKLPIRPNGTTGWILRAEVDLVDNPYRVEIDRATYLLRVFEQNEMIVETTIAIGNGATPTPVGEFYLTELLAPPDPAGVYGPFAFGLSGFSETLASFGGADVAIIGLHGTNDPSSLGNDVSHGCVRIANDVITDLAETLPLGTPVLIA